MAPSPIVGSARAPRRREWWRGGALAVVLAGLAAGCATTPEPGTRTKALGRAENGTAVGQPAPSGAQGLRSVSCPTVRACWAAGSRSASAANPGGGVVVATTDGGAVWSVQSALLEPGFLAAVSCPDARRCMAVGQSGTTPSGTVLVTTDGGRRWRVLAGPAGATALYGVQCTSMDDCVVVGQDASGFWSAETADFGSTFQRGGALPATFTSVGQLSCAPASCAVVGAGPPSGGHATGTLAVTTDGGTTWSAATLPASVGLLHAASCRDKTCAAVGTASTTVSDVVQAAAQFLTDASGSWLLSPTSPGIGDGFALTCPNAAECVTVGADWVPRSPPTPIGGVARTVDGGATWTTPQMTGLPTTLTGVDCPSATSCVAVGGDVIGRITLPAAHHRGLS